MSTPEQKSDTHTSFSINLSVDEGSDNAVPVLYIKGQKISLVTLTYFWITKDAFVGSGVNNLVVDGYLPEETTTKRWSINFVTGEVEERSHF